MDKWPLPEGWDWRKLGDLCRTTSGGTPSRRYAEYFQGEIPWVKSGELTDGIVTQVGEYISSEAMQNSNAKIFPKGTLLMAMYGATVGKLGILGMDAATNQAVCAIFPSPSIDRDYLFRLLRMRRQELIDLSFGGAQPNISQTVIKDVDVPVPYPDDITRSLEAQRRIVARLDALFAEIAEARTVHADIQADTNKLMEAVLSEAFPDPEKGMPDGWTLKAVEDISAPPQYGYTQSAKFEPVGPKFLRITDIQAGQVDWSIVPYCECSPTDLEKYRLHDGDIVFARSGATTGKTFLVKNPPEAVFASYLIRLRIEHNATPDFVYWFFQSPYYWKQVVLRGGAQPNMNAQILRKVKVSIPISTSAQAQIVTYLNNVKEQIVEMQHAQESEKTLLDEVGEALLAQAFRGEL